MQICDRIRKSVNRRHEEIQHSSSNRRFRVAGYPRGLKCSRNHESSTRVVSSGCGPHRVRGRAVAVQQLAAVAVSSAARTLRRRRREPAPARHAAPHPPRRAQSPRVVDVVSCLAAGCLLGGHRRAHRYPASGKELFTTHMCCGRLSHFELKQ